MLYDVFVFNIPGVLWLYDKGDTVLLIYYAIMLTYL